MKKKLIIIFCNLFCLILVSCQKKEPTNLILSNEPENLRLMAEGRIIFGGNLENARSFSSYASYKVLYEIKGQNLTLDEWLSKDILLKQRGWKYLGKKDNGYIYCQNMTQFEVVPPQSIIKNAVLQGGDMYKQAKDYWVIGFSTAKTSSYNMCEKERKHKVS